MNTIAPRSSVARVFFAALGGFLLPASLALAQTSATWSATAGGNWSGTANWSGGVAASGTDAVATFSASGTQPVVLDANETVGTLAFSTGTYTLSSSNGSVLTLATSTGAPVISGTANITVALVGTQGFTYNSGNRYLYLHGDNSGLSGNVTIANGQVYAYGNNTLGTGNIVVTQASNAYPQLHLSNNFTTSQDIYLQDNWYDVANLGNVRGGNFLYIDSGNTTLSGNLTLDRHAATNSNVVHLIGIQSSGNLVISGNAAGAATGGQASGTYADPTRFQLSTTATGTVLVSGSISDGTLTPSTGTVNGGANGGLSLYTTGNGVVTLSAANTYTGSTVVNGGSLIVTNTAGSGTGTGSVSIASGAVLGGTGTLAPTGSNGVTFASGSIVWPGVVSSSGTHSAAGEALTFNLAGTTGSVTFDSGSIIYLGLNGSDAATYANTTQSLAFTGLTSGVSQVTFNNNVVYFSVTGTALATGTYVIASFSADNAYTGSLTLGSDLSSYNVNAQLVETANSIELVVTSSAIPEPVTTAALLGALSLGVCCYLRRRRGGC